MGRICVMQKAAAAEISVKIHEDSVTRGKNEEIWTAITWAQMQNSIPPPSKNTANELG